MLEKRESKALCLSVRAGRGKGWKGEKRKGKKEAVEKDTNKEEGIQGDKSRCTKR